MASPALYTPELLGLATSLAEWPMLTEAAVQGEARSPTCGSTVLVSLVLDGSGRIARLGLRAHACAVGQASSALFARGAVGKNREDLAGSLNRLEAWLGGHGSLPDWPGLAAIASARDYSARHGAILLPWKAALAALPSAPDAR